MEFPFMNCRFLCQRIGSCQLVRMMTYAVFVLMVETFYSVIYAQELFTQVDIYFSYIFLFFIFCIENPILATLYQIYDNL